MSVMLSGRPLGLWPAMSVRLHCSSRSSASTRRARGDADNATATLATVSRTRALLVQDCNDPRTPRQPVPVARAPTPPGPIRDERHTRRITPLAMPDDRRGAATTNGAITAVATL